MSPEDAVRIAKTKILPWLPRVNHDWRVALETLVGHYDAALAEVELQRELEQFGRHLQQLDEPA